MMNRLIRVAIALAAVGSLGVPLPAVAGDARAGRQVAEKNCAGCHAILRVGASPFAPAPPFREIVRRYKVSDLEEALAEGVTTGHPAMPEITLPPRQIDDLLTYLRTLQRR
jgi:mono/diheme cytochrome c family protein